MKAIAFCEKKAIIIVKAFILFYCNSIAIRFDILKERTITTLSLIFILSSLFFFPKLVTLCVLSRIVLLS